MMRKIAIVLCTIWAAALLVGCNAPTEGSSAETSAPVRTAVDPTAPPSAQAAQKAAAEQARARAEAQGKAMATPPAGGTVKTPK